MVAVAAAAPLCTSCQQNYCFNGSLLVDRQCTIASVHYSSALPSAQHTHLAAPHVCCPLTFMCGVWAAQTGTAPSGQLTSVWSALNALLCGSAWKSPATTRQTGVGHVACARGDSDIVNHIAHHPGGYYWSINSVDVMYTVVLHQRQSPYHLLYGP